MRARCSTAWWRWGVDEAALLDSLPAWAFAAMLVVARIGTACMLLPGIGEAELPVTVRLGFILCLTGLVLPVVSGAMPAATAEIAPMAGMLIAEIITGLWLGWLARLILLSLPMAGQLIASATGMINVLQPDAALGAGSSALQRLLGLCAPVLLLASGLHMLPLQAIVGSYDLIPAGQFLPVGDTVFVYVRAVSEAFALALRLATPFLIAGVLYQAAIGLAARLVPQLQVYFAAMPGQILGSLALLGVIVTAVVGRWMEAAGGLLSALPGL